MMKIVDKRPSANCLSKPSRAIINGTWFTGRYEGREGLFLKTGIRIYDFGSKSSSVASNTLVVGYVEVDVEINITGTPPPYERGTVVDED